MPLLERVLRPPGGLEPLAGKRTTPWKARHPGQSAPLTSREIRCGRKTIKKWDCAFLPGKGLDEKKNKITSHKRKAQREVQRKKEN